MARNRWSAKQSRRVRKRICIEGKLVLVTPAHFGSGDSDTMTDMYLLTDAVDPKRPLLPGASLTGALRAYLQAISEGHRAPEKSYKEKEQLTPVTLLFGGSKGDDEGKQSPLIIEDAFGTLPPIDDESEITVAPERRANVRLNAATRTAEEGALFNMELWPAGTTFLLRFELLVTERTKREQKQYVSDEAKETALKRALVSALQGLEEGAITLGARKHRGLGRLTVHDWRVREYTLSEPAELVAWLEQGHNELPVGEQERVADLLSANPLPNERKVTTLNATFAIDGSLLIRDSEPAVFESDGNLLFGPDMVHLHTFDPKTREKQPTLPGTSVAGALRTRAARIVRLFASEQMATQFIGNLFGPEIRNRSKPKASNLRVDEMLIHHVINDLVQNRVKIDRFTGGAFETALFNEQPVWGKSEEKAVTVRLTLFEDKSHDKSKRLYKAQIGLLLLLLKDLWTGDLPLGGEISVGRGRLQGKSATLVVEGTEFTLTQGKDGVVNASNPTKDDAYEALQEYVNALHNYLKGEG